MKHDLKCGCAQCLISICKHCGYEKGNHSWPDLYCPKVITKESVEEYYETQTFEMKHADQLES